MTEDVARTVHLAMQFGEPQAIPPEEAEKGTTGTRTGMASSTSPWHRQECRCHGGRGTVDSGQWTGNRR